MNLFSFFVSSVVLFFILQPVFCKQLTTVEILNSIIERLSNNQMYEFFYNSRSEVVKDPINNDEVTESNKKEKLVQTIRLLSCEYATHTAWMLHVLLFYNYQCLKKMETKEKEATVKYFNLYTSSSLKVKNLTNIFTGVLNYLEELEPEVTEISFKEEILKKFVNIEDNKTLSEFIGKQSMLTEEVKESLKKNILKFQSTVQTLFENINTFLYSKCMLVKDMNEDYEWNSDDEKWLDAEEDIEPNSAEDIEPNSAEDIEPNSAEDIEPNSAEDIEPNSEKVAVNCEESNDNEYADEYEQSYFFAEIDRIEKKYFIDIGFNYDFINNKYYYTPEINV